MPEKKLRGIYCSHKACGALLCRTDGKSFYADDPKVLSKLLTNRKKRYNPLYCVACHRITRWHKPKLKRKKTV